MFQMFMLIKLKFTSTFGHATTLRDLKGPLTSYLRAMGVWSSWFCTGCNQRRSPWMAGPKRLTRLNIFSNFVCTFTIVEKEKHLQTGIFSIRDKTNTWCRVTSRCLWKVLLVTFIWFVLRKCAIFPLRTIHGTIHVCRVN